MGDVLTLIEQAEQAFEDDQKERMAAKLMGGEQFTLEDFLEQLIAVRRMGPIANMLGHDARHGPDEGPAGRAGRQALRPGHRDHPLDDPGRAGATRRSSTARGGLRIANGSGVTVIDVNQLLNRFAEAQKMMKQMGGMMGLPGAGARRPSRRRTSARAPRAAAGRAAAAAACPPASRVECRSCPPGWTRRPAAGLPPGFKLPKIDFNKLNKRDGK